MQSYLITALLTVTTLVVNAAQDQPDYTSIKDGQPSPFQSEVSLFGFKMGDVIQNEADSRIKSLIKESGFKVESTHYMDLSQYDKVIESLAEESEKGRNVKMFDAWFSFSKGDRKNGMVTFKVDVTTKTGRIMGLEMRSECLTEEKQADNWQTAKVLLNKMQELKVPLLDVTVDRIIDKNIDKVYERVGHLLEGGTPFETITLCARRPAPKNLPSFAAGGLVEVKYAMNQYKNGTMVFLSVDDRYSRHLLNRNEIKQVEQDIKDKKKARQAEKTKGIGQGGQSIKGL